MVALLKSHHRSALKALLIGLHQTEKLSFFMNGIKNPNVLNCCYHVAFLKEQAFHCFKRSEHFPLLALGVRLRGELVGVFGLGFTV